MQHTLSRKAALLIVVVALALSLSACKWTIERNEDGSWTITGNVTETEVQQMLDDSMADPLISNVKVDFHDGYITASADRANVGGTHVDSLTMRIDLSVVNDHLGVVISDVRLNGDPFDPGMVGVWNERLANRLENNARRNPNSTLTGVTITDSDLTMTWHAEGRQNN